MKLNTSSVGNEGTWMEKAPVASATTPLVVPFTNTVVPMSAFSELPSKTFPERAVDCACAPMATHSVATMSMSELRQKRSRFVCMVVVELKGL